MSDKKYMIRLADWRTNMFKMLAEERGYDSVEEWLSAITETSLDIEFDSFYDEYPDFRVMPVVKKPFHHRLAGISAVAKVFPIIMESIRVAAYHAKRYEWQNKLWTWEIRRRTVDRDEKLTDTEVLERHLGEAQREALLQFQEEDGILDIHIRTMAQVTGRGYRPPITAEVWRNYYEVWERIKLLPELPLYVWHDDTDWYVADSWQEATKLWVKRLDEKRDDYYEGQENDGWAKLGDDEEINIWWQDDDWPPDLAEVSQEVIENGECDESAGIWIVKLPAKDWARINGKGFLASTEY